tara:strand:+ start:955 stop:1422 length:468 start_codon:yes stop_codon:yes gene_type:complete
VTRTVELTTLLDAPPEEVWDRVQTSALLQHVAAPLIRFVPRGERFPRRWSPSEYRAWMFVFGIFPIGWQTIGIEYPVSPATTHVLRDNGHSPLIRRWDHWIEIAPENGGTRYTDRVHIDAGILTPLVAGFARLFYAHRQSRWRALAMTGFTALPK